MLCCWFLSSPPARAAVTWREDFSTEPGGRGWSTWGDRGFHQWNGAAGNLAVTWDSRQTNTYFVRPLGTILTSNDDFTLGFDLRLEDVATGVSTNRGIFEIGLGLINRREAFSTNFFRGAGQAVAGPRNLVEFDYFPASGAITATFSPTVVSSNNRVMYSHNFPLTFPLQVWLRFELAYTASNQLLRTTITTNGLPFGKPPNNTIGDVLVTGDFRVDAFAVCSYSEAGQPRGFGGSVLAHGALDNVFLTFPGPPLDRITGQFSNQVWQVGFASRSHWLYTLERSTDLSHWQEAAPPALGGGALLAIPDTNGPTPAAYHRVRAERP